ncbi:acyl-CoA N-acyltransferase [Bisporella sp. PMI_857]|nr:acyl-CoA N-acyltransferase [Bisporella sp. PMI_857]
MTFETFPVAEEHVDSYAALISEKMLSQGFDISMADMDLISFEIRQDMAHPQLTDFLAKDSATGKIVGFILWKYPANNLFKSTIPGDESGQATRDKDSIRKSPELFVHEQHRRRGIGNKLMQHAIKLSEERSARIILISTSKEGKALYIKLGFKEVRSDNKVDYMVKYPETK